MAARSEIIVITTKSSIKVKPGRDRWADNSMFFSGLKAKQLFTRVNEQNELYPRARDFKPVVVDAIEKEPAQRR